MNNKKVYCKNCKWLNILYEDIWIFAMWCEHPKNKIYIDTPYEQKIKYNSIDKLNKNNDCKYYEENIKYKILKLIKK